MTKPIQCRCGELLDTGDSFCASCGRPVQHTESSPDSSSLAREAEARCPSCGSEIETSDRHCAECGVSLQPRDNQAAGSASSPLLGRPNRPEYLPRQDQNSSHLGWAILAAVVIVGGISIKIAVDVSKRHSDDIKAASAAAAVPMPRALTAEEIQRAQNEARWREIDAYNARADAQKRAEAEANRRTYEQTIATISRSSDRIDERRKRFDQERQQEEEQKRIEDNQPVYFRCQNCNQTITLPKRLINNITFDIQTYGDNCPGGNQFRPHHVWQKQ